jgi:hypothetical protein
MGISFLLELAEQGHTSLWTVQDPSTWGLLTAGLLAGVGIVAVLVLLRRSEDGPAAGPRVADEVIAELGAIQLARSALLSELDASPPALRAALRPLLDGPLLDYDQRVDALVSTAKAHGGPRKPDAALDGQRTRLLAELESEDDPRARALLEASLGDMDSTRQVQVALARNGRLALLELQRMKTLLVSLPARVRELASRQGLEQGEAGDVEAIARQLEGAVRNTQEVMEGALAPKTDFLQAI